jgi:mRNA interferase RelE/StbE
LAWTIEFTPSAQRDLIKLGKAAGRDIVQYLEKRLLGTADPRRFGKALRHDRKGLWRYRVGDYRVVCQIEEDRLVVLVVGVGHRREVYR